MHDPCNPYDHRRSSYSRSYRSCGRALRALLENAWAGGSKASGRSAGSLEVGQRADIVVLNENHPALVGRSDDEIFDSWVFSGEQTPVQDVMVGGKWVIRNGQHPHEQKILKNYSIVIRRLGIHWKD